MTDSRPHDVPASGADRLSARVLAGPAAAALGAAYLLMMAAWVPQYLTWPWLNDLDHFDTFAMAWDTGLLLPYRDLPSFQFPGEYYLFWLLGKAFGWGRTAPIYALDASLVAALGAASAAWSRRVFGRALPGVVGYGVFLGYYLGLGFVVAAQRDWHASFFAVLGLFALQALPGRPGRVVSALAYAAALTIRPHVVVLGPAYAVALDASARPGAEAWRLTARAFLEWAAVLAVFLFLAFTPLIASGILDDFLRGLRTAAPGTEYNRLTWSSLAGRMKDQLFGHKRVLIAAATVALIASRSDPMRRRTATTWLVALAGAWFYKPLAPVAYGYLTHHFTVVASVVVAVLVDQIMEARFAPTLRLGLVALVMVLGVPSWPRFVNPSQAIHAIRDERTFEFPRQPPFSGESYIYPWVDYRETVLYLRRTLPADVWVANALAGMPALTGPVARLPAFPGESLAWFQHFKNRPDLEAAYLRSLKKAPKSVVVWSPAEAERDDTILPQSFAAYFRSEYEFEARFGPIEVWRPRGRAEVGAR